MTDKELKKLSRGELLELLLMQTREAELLRMQLDEAKKQLQNRELRLREVGNIADATLAINGVMESAQKAAEQYLENIRRMEEETKARCEKLLIDATNEADKIRHEADQIRREAVWCVRAFPYQVEEIKEPELHKNCLVDTQPESPVVIIPDPFFVKLMKQIDELFRKMIKQIKDFLRRLMQLIRKYSACMKLK